MKDRTKYDKKYRAETKNLKQNFYNSIGKECFICKSSVRLACHRKDFKPHMRLANLERGKLKMEKIEDYVRLCFPCHYGVHWVHNYFKLSWEEIMQFINGRYNKV
jgi:hypothetical protein